MGTLEYIYKKYNLAGPVYQNASPTNPIKLDIGRWKDFPRLLNELGFKVGAEVGVYRGKYSSYLLKFIPGLKLYGIDSWEIYGDYKDYEKTDIEEAKLEAEERAKAGNCILLQGRSNEVVTRFKDESLDFVFIDGNHAYEYVVEDIALWSKKVRPGGIISGHDFDDYSKSQKRWMDMHVQDAVRGWMRSYKIYPWFIITKNRNKCWFYVKSERSNCGLSKPRNSQETTPTL